MLSNIGNLIGASSGSAGLTLGDPLDSYLNVESWSNGGANDCAPLLTPMGAFKRFESMAFGNSGQAIMVSNNSDGKIYSYLLSTPYDLSTATNNGFNTFPGGGCIGWYGSSNYWGLSSADDGTDSFSCSAWDLDEADTLNSTISDTTLGSGSVSDGGVYCLPDGSAIYACSNDGAGDWYMGRVALSTAYDHTSNGTLVKINVNAALTAQFQNSSFWVDPTETYVYAMDSTEKIHLGTMSTPGDISTLTWSGTTLDVSGQTGVMRGVRVEEDGASIWTWDTQFSGTRMYRYY
jgi:hypothetical protein